MTKQQLQLLLDYIDARIAEMIQQADHRDALAETMNRAECAKRLADEFSTDRG